MKFFHGTSKENWEKIQKEGVLWGIRNAPSRCTYLAVEQENARGWGMDNPEVLLEVEYDTKRGDDNYCERCWQVRVYSSISIDSIKRIN